MRFTLCLLTLLAAPLCAQVQWLDSIDAATRAAGDKRILVDFTADN